MLAMREEGRIFLSMAKFMGGRRVHSGAHARLWRRGQEEL